MCSVSPKLVGMISGKDCHTEFQRISYNGVSSVVLCRPYTGRMHQIRVHLQYLGWCYLFSLLSWTKSQISVLKAESTDCWKIQRTISESNFKSFVSLSISFLRTRCYKDVSNFLWPQQSVSHLGYISLCCSYNHKQSCH